MSRNFVLYFITIFLYNSINCLNCGGEQEIPHCLKCGTGNDYNKCVLCEDKYFLFFHNLMCMSCNDQTHGQIGCGGKCDGSQYEKHRMPLCNENDCFPEFYNMEGICFKCSQNDTHCLKCSYESQNGSKEKVFKCLECDDPDYQVLNKKDGKCKKCHVDNCKKCYFDENDNDACMECEKDFYVDSNKKCSKCYWQNLYLDLYSNYNVIGRYYYCPDSISERKDLVCHEDYVKNGTYNCLSCPSGCETCSYESESFHCFSCYSSYYLLNEKCIKCKTNCGSCKFENNMEICTSCYGATYLDENECKSCGPNCNSCNGNICNGCSSGFCLDNGACLKCPSNCKKCTKESNGNTRCTECNSYYTLNTTNNQCIHCPNNCDSCYYQNNDLICDSCYYNNIFLNKRCYACSFDESIGGSSCATCSYSGNANKCYSCISNNYSHIYNIYKCLPNTDPEKEIYGCTNSSEINGKYQCITCKPGFILVTNDKRCKRPEDMNLTYCASAYNKNTTDYPAYTCNSCINTNYVKLYKYIENIQIMNCVKRTGKLIRCLEAKEQDDDNITCISCMSNFPYIWRTEYNQTVCDEKCRSYEYLDRSDNWCHNCDYRNEGCNSSFGCNYNPANTQLNCYGCKTGYYLYFFQCLHCTVGDPHSLECHFDEIEDKFKVDLCEDKYYINNKTGKCEIITYDEYPEVTPGCILSINNYTLYKEKEKCLLCKDGFFKTRDESCIYCKARKNGGPNCKECEYIIDSDGNITDSLKCKVCPDGNYMTSDGKCFNCVDEVGKGCEECEFIEDSENNEKMKCKKCKGNYFLKDGHCINDQSYYNNLPFCSSFDYQITKSENSITAKTSCKLCKNGFYKNKDDGVCKGLTIELCSYISMLNYSQPIYDECKNFCNENEIFVNITYKDFSKQLENIFRNNYNYEYNKLDENIRSIVAKGYLCFSNLGRNDNNKTEPLNLRKCIKSEYIEADDKYICTQCHEGYYLLENKTCRQNKTFPHISVVDLSNCDNITNIGKDSDSKEMLSCESCKNENDILIKDVDTGAQFCIEPIGELEGCVAEAKADTSYSNTLYNCTQCSLNYLLYASKYYKRKICQSLFGDIDEIKDLSYLNLDDDELMENIERKSAVNGKCNKEDKLFTPDGKYCYLCNNDFFGMIGCKDSCTFSDRRNNPIECEGECKEGHIETSKGVCEPCDTVNEGCKFCEYDTKYPAGYHGFKKRRRFKCNECDDGYLISDDDLCHHCSELGFSNCERCKIDQDNFDEFICSKCSVGYFLNEDGYCVKCNQPLVQGNKNKCIYCNNTDEGGIEGCEKCVSDNGKIFCQQCKEGFILLENNQKCEKISENLKLELYPNCQRVYLTENENGDKTYNCTQCFDGYNLLSDDNGERCVKDDFIVTPKDDLLKYCKNSVNIHTEDRPWHSCNQCIGNDELLQEEREKGIVFTRIIYKENNTAYCDLSKNYKALDNCTQALRKIEDNDVIYTCLNCTEGNELIKYKDKNLEYCQYYHYEKICMVKNCKTCKRGNNYFCSVCMLENYEVNPVTGACVKKMKKVPMVTWKDAFRLILNQNRTINGQNIYGPVLSMTGITADEIPEGHAFLVFLTFKILYTDRLRVLEKEEEIPTICIIKNSVDRTDDNINWIEYECIGNRTGENYFSENATNLENIKITSNNNEENLKNEEFLKSSNFEEMTSNVNCEEMKNKTHPLYSIENTNIYSFKMEDIVNQTSENYIFDINLNGKLNKELPPEKINASLELKGITDRKADCEFNIEEDKNANLNCKINLEGHEDIKEFSFKKLEIDNGNNSIYLNHLDEVKLIHEINKSEEQSKKKDYIKIILIIGAIILVGAAIVLFILIKKNIRIKEQNNITNNKPQEKLSRNNNMIESSNSTKRSINPDNKFKNNPK